MAPPQINIDEGEVARLALLNCHTRTIAEHIGVDERTLRRRCAALIKKKRAEFRISLREAQSEKAIKLKDTTMQIWLGKQYLDQRDKKEMVVGGIVGVVHTAAELKLGKKMAQQFAQEICDDS